MLPQEGDGGCIPIPIKLNVDSKIIVVAKLNIILGIKGGIRCNNMWSLNIALLLIPRLVKTSIKGSFSIFKTNVFINLQ